MKMQGPAFPVKIKEVLQEMIEEGKTEENGIPKPEHMEEFKEKMTEPEPED